MLHSTGDDCLETCGSCDRKCARMPGRPQQIQLFLFALLALYHTQVSANLQEAAVLTQLKELWSTATNDVARWVDAVDPCNGLWPGIACALKEQPLIQTRCSIANASCMVVSLNLSNNSLAGEIPFILGGLSNLQILDLHGNQLVGEVASQLFNGFPSLSYLDFSYNYFNKTIPELSHSILNYVNWQHNCFTVDGGCYLGAQMRTLSDCKNHTTLELPPCPSWIRQHPVALYILVGVCPFTFILFTFLIFMFCCWTKRTEDQIVRSGPSSSKIQSVECKHFTYKELEDSTNKFHDNKLLGCGGFGSIYQGRLEDGSYVAVKQLDKGSDQGDTEFWKEVLIIGSIRHPNLVSLRGYCREASRNERLIVYDYMPNGSVLDALRSSDDSLLPWSRRYSIALGSACGLEHLHEHCSARIIHRGIKPSNILLDRHFNARVGDFGLAKLGLPDLTEVTTAVGGAQVFVDPEYAMTGKLTDKSDVFSFGMLLLVLISGRHNMETQASFNATGKAQLLSWMQVLAKAEELSELVDPRLRGVYDKHQVSLCAQIALLCTRILPDLRPTMGEIRRFLDGTAEIPLATSLINSPNSSSRGSFVSECLTPSTTVSCYGTRASFITDCYNFSTVSCHGGDSV